MKVRESIWMRRALRSWSPWRCCTHRGTHPIPFPCHLPRIVGRIWGSRCCQLWIPRQFIQLCKSSHRKPRVWYFHPATAAAPVARTAATQAHQVQMAKRPALRMVEKHVRVLEAWWFVCLLLPKGNSNTELQPFRQPRADTQAVVSAFTLAGCPSWQERTGQQLSYDTGLLTLGS